MSRLTEREIDEIRRVQLAGADGAEATLSAPRENDRGWAGLVLRYSGLDELGWFLRHKLFGSVAAVMKRRQVIRQLHGLNEHMLKDIGLQRGQIDVMVDELANRENEMPAAPEGLFHALMAWQMRRGARAELSRLDDRLLDDIGICRGDIPAIVKSMDATAESPAARPANLGAPAAGQIARVDEKALSRLGFLKTAAESVSIVTASPKAVR